MEANGPYLRHGGVVLASGQYQNKILVFDFCGFEDCVVWLSLRLRWFLLRQWISKVGEGRVDHSAGSLGSQSRNPSSQVEMVFVWTMDLQGWGGDGSSCCLEQGKPVKKQSEQVEFYDVVVRVPGVLGFLVM